MYGGGMYGGGYGGGMYGGVGGMSGMGLGMSGMSGMPGMGLGGLGGGMSPFGVGMGGLGGGSGRAMGLNSFSSPLASGPGTFSGVEQNTFPNSQLKQPPPPSELGGQRRKSRKTERHRERELLERQRQQQKQLKLRTVMEITGLATQVLLHVVRSSFELFGVCFGTYYSVKAVKAFVNSANARDAVNPSMAGLAGTGAMGALSQRAAGTQGRALASAASAGAAEVVASPAAASAMASRGIGRWGRAKGVLLAIVIYVAFEVIYGIIQRRTGLGGRSRRVAHERATVSLGHHSRAKQRLAGADKHALLSSDECSDDELSDGDEESEVLLDSDESASSDAALEETWASGKSSIDGEAFKEGAVNGCRGTGTSRGRRYYVAIHDYQQQQSHDDGVLSFRKGDHFIIDDYAESLWCDAVLVANDSSTAAAGQKRGLVPGNFLRPLEIITKF